MLVHALYSRFQLASCSRHTHTPLSQRYIRSETNTKGAEYKTKRWSLLQCHDRSGSLTLVSLVYLWKRVFARAHRTPLATGLRIQGPGVTRNTSKIIIEGARGDPGVLTFFCRLCRIISLLKKNPSAPVKDIVQLFLFAAEWIKTVQLFVINNIFTIIL